MSLEHPGLMSTGGDPESPRERPVVDAPTAAERAPLASSPVAAPSGATDPRRDVEAPPRGAKRAARRSARFVGRPSAGRRRARKVQRIVRRVDPASVLKVSLLFYLCLFGILLVAGAVLWQAGRATNVVDEVEELVTDYAGLGRCRAVDDVPAGTRTYGECTDSVGDEGVIIDGFQFDGPKLLAGVTLGGLVLVIAGSAGMVLLAVLFNLISDVTGGVRLTVLEEEPSRAPPNAATPHGGSPP